MPVNAQKVEELDFNKLAGRPITVDDLLSGMNNMGFQASSIGEAVRIINDMVRCSSLIITTKPDTISVHGVVQNHQIVPPFFLDTLQI